MADREQQIQDVMQALGLSRAEAEEYVAVANRESDGDVVNTDEAGANEGRDS